MDEVSEVPHRQRGTSAVGRCEKGGGPGMLEKRLESPIVLNPGSIGPLRLRLPVALALATVRDGALDVQPVVLDDRTG